MNDRKSAVLVWFMKQEARDLADLCTRKGLSKTVVIRQAVERYLSAENRIAERQAESAKTLSA